MSKYWVIGQSVDGAYTHREPHVPGRAYDPPREFDYDEAVKFAEEQADHEFNGERDQQVVYLPGSGREMYRTHRD